MTGERLSRLGGATVATALPAVPFKQDAGYPVHLCLSAMVRTLALGSFLTLAIACSSAPAAAPGSTGVPPDPSGEARTGPLDDTLHVELGRTATADNGRLALTFTARLSDSRCPANAVCVWMGDAAVRVSARAGRTTVERDLHTGVEPHSLSVDRYTVTVVGLTPYPGAEASGKPPTVVLRVERR